MGILGKATARGLAAGAAGTTALNGVSQLDALWRGRPPSDAPERLIGVLADRAGVDVPGGRAERRHRIAALGPLSGLLTGVVLGGATGALRGVGVRLPTAVGGPLLGVAAMLASDGPLAWARISDPRRWSAADWTADVLPHLAYGLTTHRTLVALDNEKPRLPRPRVGTLVKAAALGVATGSRSTAGVAALALTSSSADGGAVLSRLASRPGTVAALGAAAGELVADKLPFTPSRLAASGMAPRLTLAAAAATGVARRDGESPEPAAVVATAAAVVGAVLGTRLRAVAARRFGSDRPGALIEDGLTATLAWFGARRA